MVPTFLCVSLVVLAVLIGILLANREWEAFNQRFPPLSDAEFVARCAKGTNPQVALKVRRIVAECLGVEYERIYPSSRFAEDLGAD